MVNPFRITIRLYLDDPNDAELISHINGSLERKKRQGGKNMVIKDILLAHFKNQSGTGISACQAKTAASTYNMKCLTQSSDSREVPNKTALHESGTAPETALEEWKKDISSLAELF